MMLNTRFSLLCWLHHKTRDDTTTSCQIAIETHAHTPPKLNFYGAFSRMLCECVRVYGSLNRIGKKKSSVFLPYPSSSLYSSFFIFFPSFSSFFSTIRFHISSLVKLKQSQKAFIINNWYNMGSAASVSQVSEEIFSLNDIANGNLKTHTLNQNKFISKNEVFIK